MDVLILYIRKIAKGRYRGHFMQKVFVVQILGILHPEKKVVFTHSQTGVFNVSSPEVPQTVQTTGTFP